MRFFLVLFIIIIFVINLFSCSDELNENTIAKIGDYEITVAEFQLRYNFNPYLKDIHSQNQAKKVILSALIAEKILYQENKKTGMHNVKLNQLRNQYLKEAMIETIRMDSIESQIKISDEELKKEYLKSLKEFDIKFIAFSSLEEAASISAEIERTGNFESVIRNYMNSKGWESEIIPDKKVIWGNEPYQLEQSIFNLEKGEISEPVAANNEYYLIKIENISQSNKPSNEDFQNRKPALTDRITRNKIKSLYKNFYNRNIREKMGNVDWKVYRKIVDIMISEIQFNQNPEMMNQNKPFSEISSSSLLNKIRKNMDYELVTFPDGNTWSIKEVLKNMEIGPYVFNFKNEVLFRRSCARNLELMQEHHVIYTLAMENNYKEHTQVQTQFKMWDAFYSSNDKRFSILDTVKIKKRDTLKYKNKDLTLIQNKRLHTFDKFISNILDNYEIQINNDLYQTIKLNKQDMVVVKSHFANRLSAPPVEPLFSLPMWTAKMDSIFKKIK